MSAEGRSRATVNQTASRSPRSRSSASGCSTCTASTNTRACCARAPRPRRSGPAGRARGPARGYGETSPALREADGDPTRPAGIARHVRRAPRLPERGRRRTRRRAARRGRGGRAGEEASRLRTPTVCAARVRRARAAVRGESRRASRSAPRGTPDQAARSTARSPRRSPRNEAASPRPRPRAHARRLPRQARGRPGRAGRGRGAIVRALTRKYRRPVAELVAGARSCAPNWLTARTARARSSAPARAAKRGGRLPAAGSAHRCRPQGGRDAGTTRLSKGAQAARLPRTPGSVFEVAPAATGQPGPTGLDDVQLLFTANPGEPARPLQKIASGGELSRVMLALARAANP